MSEHPTNILAQPQPRAVTDASSTSTSSEEPGCFQRLWFYCDRLFHATNPYIDARRIANARARLKIILDIVDDRGFNSRIFFVAASGFLASSYSLFSTNVLNPALDYIYPPCGRLHGRVALIIDLVTLTGTVWGMIVIGHTADQFGRKRLYGYELAILIVATVGLVQAGPGYMYHDANGISMYSMDYPLSAVIAVEWASTESRGTMLAAVKSMQSLARLLAVAIGLAALSENASRHGYPPGIDESRVIVDQTWRTAMAIAIIPAALAILLRVTLPETPRYYADIVKDLRRALVKVIQVYPPVQTDERQASNTGTDPTATPAYSDAPEYRPNKKRATYFAWWKNAIKYLRTTKNPNMLLRLLSIAVLWAIMDAGFYGMSLESPSVLATLTTSHFSSEEPKSSSTTETSSTTPQVCANGTVWQADRNIPSIDIYKQLENNSVRSLLIVAIASLAGSAVAIAIVHLFRRKIILVYTFAVLSVLFAITGATLYTNMGDGKDHTVTIVFYAITQFIYNIGPNTMIFVLAAEVFPTVYRGTFFGLVAAGGKIGAIIIRSVIGRTLNGEKALAVRLLVFVPIMLFAAFLSWHLPEVQYPQGMAPTQHVAEDGSVLLVPRRDRHDGRWWGFRLFTRLKLLNIPLEATAPDPELYQNVVNAPADNTREIAEASAEGHRTDSGTVLESKTSTS